MNDLNLFDEPYEIKGSEERTSEEVVDEVMNRDVSKPLREVMERVHMGAVGLEDELEDDLEDESGVVGKDAEAENTEDEVSALYSLIERGILARTPEHKVQPSLERVQLAMNILGDPQNSYRSIHLTGTNGKTSTSRMISSLLRASGRKVGRFTSPHLHTMRERISVNEEALTEAEFVAAFEDVAPYIEIVDEHSKLDDGPSMSFFEVLTVIMLAAFADVPVDAAVIEVGMGGTWDATNVINPDVAVIAPIGIDHEKWLGSSIEEIATEKAGIIKPGTIVICAKQEPAAMEIIRNRADEVGAQLRVVGGDLQLVSRKLAVGGQVVSIQTPAALYSDIFVPLFGEHQAENAVLALAAVEAFNGGRELEASIVDEGFRTATSPGRLEVVRTSPSIVVDSAHNPHGAKALAKALNESFDYTNIVGVYSAMADKDVEATLAELEPVLEDIVITSMNTPRAMDVEEIAAIARSVFGEDRVFVEPSLLDAIDRGVERAELNNDPAGSNGVIVFGSVMLAGAARDLIKHS